VTLTAAFRRPFAFQVAAFRLRLQQLQPTMKWTDVWQEGHDRAFMVAGVMKADILADLAAAVDKAISQGTSLEEFRRDFRKIVAEKGWIGGAGQGTKGGEAWRTRVIYRTNMASTYAAGRWAQLHAAGYPFIIYHHGNSLEPRVQHLAWDGLVLEADHPFWATHAPPNGWGCSCYVSGARTMDQARRLGGKPGKELPDGWQTRDPRTGAPKGIDKGWAYAPGASVADEIATMVKSKADTLPAPLAAEVLNRAARLDVAMTERQVLSTIRKIDKGWDIKDERDAVARWERAAVPGLTKAEALAIYSYTLRTFAAVNHAARSAALGLPADADAVNLLAQIQRGLERLPVYTSATVRGVSEPSARLLGFFRSASVGDNFSFEALTSTAKEQEKAFPGELRFFIRGKSGRDVSFLSRFEEKEEEVILPPGLQFTILAKQEVDGVLMIEVEEIRRHRWTDLPKESRHDEDMGSSRAAGCR
jgi:hypothetical protein